jgi:hypothetical protein
VNELERLQVPLRRIHAVGMSVKRLAHVLLECDGRRQVPQDAKRT